MYEPPVALFVPPELTAVDVSPVPLALPVTAVDMKLPAPELGRLLLGTAVVDRSGRVRDRVLMDALGWVGGLRLAISVWPSALVLRPDPDGAIQLDGRDQAALPSGARTLLGITPGQRVVLAALVDADVLVVHPMEAVAGWLASRYDELLGCRDDP